MTLPLSPQSYTDRDFETTVNAAIALKNTLSGNLWTDDNYSNAGRALIDMVAMLQDMLQAYLDQQANQLYPYSNTVFQYLRQLAVWWDATIREATAATVTLKFTRSTTGTELVIPAYTSIRTSGDRPLTFQTQSSLTLGIGVATGTVTAEHSTRHIKTDVATTGKASQRIVLDNRPFLALSETISIGGSSWERVTNFLDSGSSDKHYRVDLSEDSKGRLQAEIVFGDGVNGALPSPGQTVTITYKTGGGATGNTPAGTITKPVSFSAATVTNEAAAQGGADRMSHEQAKASIPLGISTNKRSVGREDFSIHAEQVGGVLRASVLTVNDWSGIDENTVVVLIVPDYDPATVETPPTPTTLLKTKVLQFIRDQRPTLVTARVITADPEFHLLTPNITVKLKGTEYADAVESQIITNIREWFDLGATEADGSPRIEWGDTVYMSKLYDLVWNVNDDLGGYIVRDVQITDPVDDLTLQPFELPLVTTANVTVTVEDIDDSCTTESAT